MSNLRYALITGASRGVGRALATSLSRKGYTIIASSRDHSALSALLTELDGEGHHVVEADLSTQEGISGLAEAARGLVGEAGLRAFIHCAAQTPDPEAEAHLDGTDLKTLDGHLSVTARSGPVLLQLLKPMLATARKSHAILISSDWVIDGIVGPPIFSAAKSFVTTVWRDARKEYLETGTVLCSIVAGNIASYDLDWVTPKWTLDSEVAEIKAELGNTRISLQDIARAVEFILETPFAAVTELRMVPLDPDYVP